MIGQGSTIVAFVGYSSGTILGLAPIGAMNACVLGCSAQVTLAWA
jgi:hypothetical protein